MNRVRQHLRATAIAWLCLQVVTLAVLMPRTCCPGHEKTAAAPAPPAEQCPLHEAKAPKPECRMSAACGGPVAALPMSVGAAGTTVASFRFEPAFTSTRVHLLTQRAPVVEPVSTTPPPKA
jgi:hypothetical protein